MKMDNTSMDNISVAATASSRSPSSPGGFSSSTTSPLIKGRPIRPLPKKPLRSRLSPEVAQSIKYPPAPKVSRPLFYPSYDNQDLSSTNETFDRDLTAAQFRSTEAQKIICASPAKDYIANGHDHSSDEEIGDESSGRGRNSSSAPVSSTRSKLNGNASSQLSNATKPQRLSAAPSVESVDDSFENTNNKKKRKIPTGNFQGHHTLSLGMAQMDISTSRNLDTALATESSITPMNVSGATTQANTGVGMGRSGVGRGSLNRLPARNGSGRSPLGVSINGSNALHTARNSMQRRDDHLYIKDPGQQSLHSQGIISSTMAQAASLPNQRANGQENMSVLEQHASKNPQSKTQFTFTCGSDTGKGVAWPGQHPSLSEAYPDMPEYLQDPRDSASQVTRTSPNTSGQPPQTLPPDHGNLRSPQSTLPPQSAPPQQTARKPRRSLAKQLILQARSRRSSQEFNNIQHPPTRESIWICEFCEYENIFGQPPEALIRQYEEKDRRNEKRSAEKRRLLEKAKMKGRKGKKGSKAAAKSNAGATNVSQQQSSVETYDQQLLDDPLMQDPGPQSEEFLTADYDDDPLDMPGAMPASPSRIPRPIRQSANHPLRPGGGLST